MKTTFKDVDCKITNKASKLWDSGVCHENLHVLGLVDGKIKKLASAGFYTGYSPSASMTCIVSVGYGPDRISASGETSGYGYHKQSAAFSRACSNAGITFDQGVSGAGEHAVREALFSIVRDFYPECDASTLVMVENNIHSPEISTEFYLKDDEEQSQEMNGV